MKTIKTKLNLVMVSLVLLLAAPMANAFYMAEAGRWINRDPIGEGGFQSTATGEWIPITPNMSLFVDNNPISGVDGFGLVRIDPQCAAGCTLQYIDCISGLANLAGNVGMGGVSGLGYSHATTKGSQKLLTRAGGLTKYSRGMMGGAAYGATLGLMCLLTQCAAEEQGCLSGCPILANLPTPMFPYSNVNAPPLVAY